MKKIKIFSGIILLSLLIPSLSFVSAQGGNGNKPLAQNLQNRIENRIENQIERASTTQSKLENRENNIERIRARIASTTLATTSTSSVRRMEKLDNRLEKQQEQMEKAKERLLNKELKITEVLNKIAEKIQARINILETRGLNMTGAKSKLGEANAKLEEITTEEENLANLLKTEITEENQVKLFQDIRASQIKIRTLARTTHALLVDTIKEINKVLPKNGRATSTATTTD